MKASKIPYTIAPFTGGTPLQPWMTLALKHRHPRDNLIHFDEPTHIYTVKGSSKGICSITTFLHQFFPHFDPDVVIPKMMKSKNWPNSKWFGMSAAAIKAAWSANGKESSEAGTAMHLGIEMVMNGAEAIVEDSIKASIEWRYFWNYWRDDCKIWEPWRTEWEVWDEDLKLSGSVDMIYRNKKDGTFAVYDWKRAKEIKMENTFEGGYGPVSHLPNCNYWHYTLQLNLYRWLLEKHYGVVVSEMALVVIHPNNKNFKRYKLNRLEDEIEGVIEARRLAVAEGKGRVAVLEDVCGGHAAQAAQAEEVEEEEDPPPLKSYGFQD